jgi:hypothetical protein
MWLHIVPFVSGVPSIHTVSRMASVHGLACTSTSDRIFSDMVDRSKKGGTGNNGGTNMVEQPPTDPWLDVPNICIYGNKWDERPSMESVVDRCNDRINELGYTNKSIKMVNARGRSTRRWNK